MAEDKTIKFDRLLKNAELIGFIKKHFINLGIGVGGATQYSVLVFNC